MSRTKQPVFLGQYDDDSDEDIETSFEDDPITFYRGNNTTPTKRPTPRNWPLKRFRKGPGFIPTRIDEEGGTAKKKKTRSQKKKRVRSSKKRTTRLKKKSRK